MTGFLSNGGSVTIPLHSRTPLRLVSSDTLTSYTSQWSMIRDFPVIRESSGTEYRCKISLIGDQFLHVYKTSIFRIIFWQKCFQWNVVLYSFIIYRLATPYPPPQPPCTRDRKKHVHNYITPCTPILVPHPTTVYDRKYTWFSKLLNQI